MASKTVILLLALLAAVLVLQVAVADHDGLMTSRAPGFEDDAVGVFGADHDEDEDPEAATDDPTVTSAEDDVGDDDGDVSSGGQARELMARVLAEAKTCTTNRDCHRVFHKAGCCNNKCKNLRFDSRHCGKCGRKCNRGYICQKKKCMSLKRPCKYKMTRCYGKCVKLNSDPKHCGKCHNKCGFGKTCCSGTCVHLATDNNHCGRCDCKCPNGVQCAFGLCGYGST